MVPSFALRRTLLWIECLYHSKFCTSLKFYILLWCSNIGREVYRRQLSHEGEKLHSEIVVLRRREIKSCMFSFVLRHINIQKKTLWSQGRKFPSIASASTLNSVTTLSLVFGHYSSNLHFIYLRKKLDASVGENVDTMIISILKIFLHSLILFVTECWK